MPADTENENVETPIVDTGAPAGEAAPEKTETPAKPEPTVGDAVEDALKALEPKPPEGEVKAEGEEKEHEDEIDLDHPRERDPVTGKFLPRKKADGEPEPKPADKAAKPEIDPVTGKPVEVKPPVEGAKKADPINDPIPKELKESTRERITTLIAMTKEAQSKAAESDRLFQHIADTGASPEQFGSAISYMRYFHSKDPADTKKAYDIALSEVRGLALKLGITTPGVDFLDAHPDLKMEVESGNLTAKHARELALARTRAEDTNTTTQAENERRQQAEEIETARQGGIKALDALGKELQVDPEYRRKYDVLVPALKPVFARLHPSLWADAFRDAYTNLKLPAAATAPANGAGAGARPAIRQQPLRPKQPSGEGAKQPKSMLEAIDAALEEHS